MPVQELEAEQRCEWIQSEPQRVVQPKACDKNTKTPLEPFVTSTKWIWCGNYFGNDISFFHF